MTGILIIYEFINALRNQVGFSPKTMELMDLTYIMTYDLFNKMNPGSIVTNGVKQNLEHGQL